jgi:hypothetical protein
VTTHGVGPGARVSMASENDSKRLTPEHGEEEDLDDCEGDEQLATSDVAGCQLVLGSTGRGEEEVTAETGNQGTNDFAHTSVEQHLSSTHSLDQPESGNASDKGDHACRRWVSCGSRRRMARPTQDELDLVRVETSVGLSEESGTVEVVD